MPRVASCLLLLTVVSAPRVAAQPPARTQLGIRKIVLYKHGIGYFERQGAVEGDVTIPLSFKTDQMRDVLKSLYAVDLGGGAISSILYDSKDPIERQLDDILFRVPEGNALTKFLEQLKGARVSVQLGGDELTGRILGIEPLMKRSEQGVTTSYKLVLLDAEGAIRPVELLDASQVSILDPEIRGDLARMMDIYAKARYADRKTVTLRAVGSGKRDVRVGYIIETPIWKTSYRLIRDEDGTDYLQGWGIVENRTDEDWKDVQLTFVAGSPLSFVMDLYTSYYPRRPVLAMEIASAAAPSLKALRPPSAGRRVARRARKSDKSREKLARSEDRFADRDARAAPSMSDLLASSLAPAMQGVTVGELFAYEAKGPVTIKQGQAALVPILFEKLDGGKRVLYWRQDLSRHPSHAFYLENSTKLTLEKGPVTVFESGTCLGEGMLAQTLSKGMHAILPYALETSVEVELRRSSKPQRVERSTLAGGILTLYRKDLRETTYELRNKSDKAHDLRVDHARAGGTWKLVGTEKPEETTPGYHRFRVTLAAGTNRSLVVREETPVSSAVSISTASTGQIRLHLRERYLSEGARKLLERVVGLMDARSELDAGLASAREELDRLTRDESRIRSNMGILRTTPKELEVREKYLARLLETGSRIEELHSLIGEKTEARAATDRRIRDELRGYRD